MARTDDPSVPTIEAPTMEELQAKIQTQLLTTITAQIPGFKMPLALARAAAAWGKATSQTLTVTNANGESVINKQPDPEEIRQFAKQFAGILQKDFPQLAQELSEKAENGVPSGSTLRDGSIPQTSLPAASLSNASSDSFTKDAANRPILPEANSAWKLVVIFAVALVLALTLLTYAHH